MIKQFREEKIIYKLPLSDGTVWGFSATHEIFPWLEKFASIMEIQKGELREIHRRILFLAHKPENLPNHEIIKNEDWNILKQGSAYRIWSHSNIPETFIELNHNFLNHSEICVINMWSSLKQIYKYYLENNSAPIHATFAEFNGKGILIAASGGTGKSTCYNRLPAYWQPLSDDNALILRDSNNNFRVHPMPTWSDHLWNRKHSTFKTSYSVPLHGIFFLEQAPHDKVKKIARTDSIRKLFESTKQIWESYWERIEKNDKINMTKKLFDTVFDITNKIPCYRLSATLHGEFWKEIEKVIE